MLFQPIYYNVEWFVSMLHPMHVKLSFIKEFYWWNKRLSKTITHMMNCILNLVNTTNIQGTYFNLTAPVLVWSDSSTCPGDNSPIFQHQLYLS